MEKVNILGVSLAKLSKFEVLKSIEAFLADSEPRLIVTPNAELILRAQKDEEFFYILNHADLAVLDGSGPQFASWATGNFIRRYPGADLVVDLLQIAQAKNQSVLILNWEAGLLSQAEITATLKQNYPALDFHIIDTDREGTKLNLAEIDSFSPAIIISTLGAPYQEKILYRNLRNIPGLRLAIGIGGALDFLAGKVKRAPRIMRILGLEWLWRVLKKPDNPGQKIVFNRYARIWNATCVFVYKFLRWQFVLPYFYRPNVACWLYKKTGDDYFVLMVERSDQPGHWQIPQGGTDGNPIEVAGTRELEEELGITEMTLIKSYPNLWKWDFTKQNRAEVKKHLGYKGQSQSLIIARYDGEDHAFKINYWDHLAWKWVNVNDLLTTAHERRHVGYKIFLRLFNDLKNKHEV